MNKPPFIIFNSKTQSRFLKEQDISACIANGNYTKIVLSNKEEFTISKKLKPIAEKLNEETFCRIHNSHIVNIQHLRGFNIDGNHKVTLSNGLELVVSKRKKAEFLGRFENL